MLAGGMRARRPAAGLLALMGSICGIGEQGSSMAIESGSARLVILTTGGMSIKHSVRPSWQPRVE